MIEKRRFLIDLQEFVCSLELSNRKIVVAETAGSWNSHYSFALEVDRVYTSKWVPLLKPCRFRHCLHCLHGEGFDVDCWRWHLRSESEISPHHVRYIDDKRQKLLDSHWWQQTEAWWAERTRYRWSRDGDSFQALVFVSSSSSLLWCFVTTTSAFDDCSAGVDVSALRSQRWEQTAPLVFTAYPTLVSISYYWVWYGTIAKKWCSLARNVVVRKASNRPTWVWLVCVV